jgi:superfamily I DNA/RNA helicase
VFFYDEAQDMSAAEVKLAQFWGDAAESVVMVGDPDQALYVWRGADPDGVFDWCKVRRVLSQSYRVPATVVAQSRSWLSRAPGYTAVEYFPRKNEEGVPVKGRVIRREGAYGWSYQRPEEIVASAIETAREGRTAMIQASCGYMLHLVTHQLRQHGAPFHNPWRPQQGAWNPLGKRDGITTPQRLLAFLRPSKKHFGEKARFWSAADLRAWGLALRATGVFVHGGKAALKALPDKATQHEVLAFLSKWFEPEARAAIGALSINWWLDSLEKAKAGVGEYAARVLAKSGSPSVFDEEPKIIVGTIHSLKGSEADVVYLMPDISPSGAEDYNGGGEAGVLATHRLFYVGMTRAREQLVICASSNAAQSVFI